MNNSKAKPSKSKTKSKSMVVVDNSASTDTAQLNGQLSGNENSSQILQLLFSIDERLKENTAAVNTLVKAQQALSESVDECKHRIIALEEKDKLREQTLSDEQALPDELIDTPSTLNESIVSPSPVVETPEKQKESTVEEEDIVSPGPVSPEPDTEKQRDKGAKSKDNSSTWESEPGIPSVSKKKIGPKSSKQVRVPEEPNLEDILTPVSVKRRLPKKNTKSVSSDSGKDTIKLPDIDCPKLKLIPAVVVKELSRDTKDSLKRGNGSIRITPEFPSSLNSVLTGLTNFKGLENNQSVDFVGGSTSSSRKQGQKRKIDQDQKEDFLPSGSDDNSRDFDASTTETTNALAQHISDLIEDLDCDKSEENQVIFIRPANEILEPQPQDENYARTGLVSLSSSNKKKKNEDSDRKSIITPKVVGLSGNSDSEGSGKSSSKKLRSTRSGEKSGGEKQPEVSTSTPRTRIPRPSYLQDVKVKEVMKSKSKTKLSKLVPSSSSDDNSSSEKNKSAAKKTSINKGSVTDDSDMELLVSVKEKLIQGDGKIPKESKSSTEDTKTRAEDSECSRDSDFVQNTRSKRSDKVKDANTEQKKTEKSNSSSDEDVPLIALRTSKSKSKTESNCSADSDFVPETKKKVLKKRKRLGSESSKSSKKSESDSIGDDSGTDSDSSKAASKKRKPKKKRSRTSASSSDEAKQKTSQKRRRRIKVENSSESDGKAAKTDADGDSDVQLVDSQSPGKGRKNIRKVMKDKELEKTTRQAAKEEEERKRRIAEKQELFNKTFTVPDEASQRLETLVLDFDKETKTALLSVDPVIVASLKPHQAEGIKFMWDTCFESLKKPVTGGCILAHCMGLGKTLQTIAFLHTVLSEKVDNCRHALVICPLSTVGNWYNEFRQWCTDCDKRPKVHKLWESKGNNEKINALQDYRRLGGIGIIHYDGFRILANSDNKGKKKKLSKRQLSIIEESLLDPGPDIVVCDEGHLLKNATSQQTKAVMKIRTQRRIVLTGTPLQNNLVEYHTMMSFVKPNLLGTLKEFRNRFVNPIANGQHKDSDARDVTVMKRRAHVLHKLLDGCVQRLDYSVLTPYLPPKFEYAICINLSDKQKQMYSHYLKNLAGNSQDATFVSGKLFADYQALVKIWTHPVVLTFKSQKKSEDNDSESEFGSLKDFVVDRSTSEEESEMSKSGSDDDVIELDKNRKPIKRSTRSNPILEEVEEVPSNDLGLKWYSSFFENRDEMEKLELSGKLVVLFEILKICEQIGDKILIFSQFLTSLDLIEDFLAVFDAEGKKQQEDMPMTFPPTAVSSIGRWRPDIEYFRIDGSTKTDDRQKHCDTFNHKNASRAKLFLISTRAGGLGINLTGANRVIIFDASWNPSHDLQSIFRIYRFGQTKPCYVYRLLARGTMEEKIYNRQVVKLSLSCRVVDEQQIERHFQFDEIRDMYRFNPEDETERPVPIVPKDRLLADLLISQENWIFSYLEHDSLLENKEEEELTEAERKAAWDDYNNEGKQERLPVGLVANEPWLLTALPKLKFLYPEKSEAELYALCLETKKDYANLSYLITAMQTPGIPNDQLTTINQNINHTVARLKVHFGDTVNWNAHVQEKAQSLLVKHNEQRAQMARAVANAQYYQQLRQSKPGGVVLNPNYQLAMYPPAPGVSRFSRPVASEMFSPTTIASGGQMHNSPSRIHTMNNPISYRQVIPKKNPQQ